MTTATEVYGLIGRWLSRNIPTQEWSNHPDWGIFRPDETYDIPGLGVVEVVERTTDTEREGDFEYWSQPVWIVLAWQGRFFQIVGKNVSHSGEDWDYPMFREVSHGLSVVRVWSRKEEDEL